MNARELIEKLQALSDEDKEKVVFMEGCDCFGECQNVNNEHYRYIYLER